MGKAKSVATNESASSGAVYGLGFIGALIYFLQAANGLWEFILAFLQAAVWPAYIVYKLLESFYGLV
ncbi:MAG: hypothetical protein MUF85_00210 [Patescibacteria group bacterium]|jgi:hypothetical protein|nr:hypothetical protein [Patescibacteria group bacterium]